jgi:hypothetical protein
MHPPNIPAAVNTSTALIDFMIGFSNARLYESAAVKAPNIA